MIGLKISKSQIQKLASNLRLLLDERHISENDIAQALDLPVMTVRRIVSGETTDPRISTLKLIADYFNVSIDSLVDDMAKPASSQKSPQFIPILDWQTATTMSGLNELNLTTWKTWHPIALGDQHTLSAETFALESRPSMQPRFPIGTLLVIDPAETPRDGDMVLVKLKQENELSLRELIIDPPKWQLQPVVAGSEMFFYDQRQHHLIGVVVLTMLFTRKDRS